MNTLLLENARQWGVNKGLTGPNGTATIHKQFRKFVEEMAELFLAITENDIPGIRDAIGDLQVVIVQANSIVHGVETLPVDHRVGRPTAHKDIESLAALALHGIMAEPSVAFTAVRQISIRLGYDPDECMQEACDIINKRTGKMIDGVFVKDSKEGA